MNFIRNLQFRGNRTSVLLTFQKTELSAKMAFVLRFSFENNASEFCKWNFSICIAKCTTEISNTISILKAHSKTFVLELDSKIVTSPPFKNSSKLSICSNSLKIHSRRSTIFINFDLRVLLSVGHNLKTCSSI